MALRNAFAKLVTESVEGAIEAVLTRLDERETRRGYMETPRALQYARTATDAMRVNIENQTSTLVYAGSTATNIAGGSILLPWFGQTSVNMMDEREIQRTQSEQQFNVIRQRWVFS